MHDGTGLDDMFAADILVNDYIVLPALDLHTFWSF